MNWFRNLKTNSKLIVILSGVTLIYTGIIIFLISNIISLGDMQDAGSQRAQDAINIGSIRVNLKIISEQENDAIINQSLDEFKRNVPVLKDKNKEDQKSLSKIADTKDEKEWAVEFSNQSEKYFQKIENTLIPTLSSNSTNKSSEIEKIDSELDVIRAAADKQLTLFSESINKEAVQADAEYDSIKKSTIRLSIIILIIGIIIAFTFLVLVSKKFISSPINLLVSKFEEVFASDSKGNAITKDEIVLLTEKVLVIADQQKQLAKDLFEQSKLISESSVGLFEISTATASSSEELLAQTNTAASSSEQVSANVSSVTSAVEEMSASIREISKNTTHSVKIIGEATRKADEATKVMDRLGVSSSEIGNIVKVITGIAEQTNLLALNATIEAARAGELGKGFAVVANEVKELAKESAKASEDITNKIKTIINDSQNAIKAISEINSITLQVNDIANTIASAVEEQSATANEINRNISEASKGTSSMSEVNISISDAAKESSKLAVKIKNSSSELEKLSKSLEDKLKANYNL